jgi:hypothetical protein
VRGREGRRGRVSGTPSIVYPIQAPVAKALSPPPPPLSFPPPTSLPPTHQSRAPAVLATPPASVNATLMLYRVCAPGVCAGHHRDTALWAAARVMVALDAPAGRDRGCEAEPPGQAPVAVRVPVVAARELKWTTTSTEKSPWSVSDRGAVGSVPL